MVGKKVHLFAMTGWQLHSILYVFFCKELTDGEARGEKSLATFGDARQERLAVFSVWWGQCSHIGFWGMGKGVFPTDEGNWKKKKIHCVLFYYSIDL
jgi:hypothetical protein